MDYFPVLIVGGGDVAFRKARAIYPFASKLKVISKEINSDFMSFIEEKNIPFNIMLYSKECLKSIRLCIAATSKVSVNSKIAKDCLGEGILCNDISSYEAQIAFSSFVSNEESLLVSFFTYGKAPLVARKLKDDFESYYAEDYINIIDFISRHRDKWNKQLNPKLKKEFWKEIFSFLKKDKSYSISILEEECSTILKKYT